MTEIRSKASDEKPLLEEEGALYEMLEDLEKKEPQIMDESTNNTAGKEIVPSRNNKTPLERYEAGKWAIMTSLAVIGVIVLMATVAAFGTTSLSFTRRFEEKHEEAPEESSWEEAVHVKESSNLADETVAPAAEHTFHAAEDASVSETPLAHVAPEAADISGDTTRPSPLLSLANRRKGGPPIEPAPTTGPDEDLLIEEATQEPNFTFTPAPEENAASTPGEAASAPEFDETAIKELVESASRYAHEVMTNNETHIFGHLETILFHLTNHPRECLAVEFGREADEGKNDEDGNVAREDDIKEWGWPEGVGRDALSPFTEESPEPPSDPEGDSGNDDSDGDEEAVNFGQKLGFLVNFWDYVKQFAVDSLRISGNYWNAVFGGDEEMEEEAVEVAAGEEGKGVDGAAKKKLESREDQEKKSQLKRLVDKVKKVVRSSGDRQGYKRQHRIYKMTDQS